VHRLGKLCSSVVLLRELGGVLQYADMSQGSAERALGGERPVVDKSRVPGGELAQGDVACGVGQYIHQSPGKCCWSRTQCSQRRFPRARRIPSHAHSVGMAG